MNRPRGTQRRIPKQPLALAHGGLYSGFSLWELVVILTILAGLITAVLTLAPRLVKRNQSENQLRLLHQVERQLRGFAVANGRLPCPDGDGDGIEDCALGAINALPYKTLGLGGADFGLGRIALRYGVYRNAGAGADLAALVDRFNPTDADGKVHMFSQLSSLDFCDALDKAAAASPGTGMVYIRDAAGLQRNVAYSVAVAGLRDADGVNGLFDGLNGQAGVGFAAPNVAPSSGYDDMVLARSFSALAQALNCDITRNSLDSLANAVAVTDEVADQADWANTTAILGTVIAAGVTVGTGIKTAVAAGMLATASATESTAAALLDAAIAACLASLGATCGAIAAPAAAVVLAGDAIVTAGTAVALDAAAVAAAAVSTGLHAAIAVRASAASNPGSFDLSQAVADLQAALNDAEATLAQARTDENNAINAEAAALNTFNTENTNLRNRLSPLPNGARAIASLDAAIAAENALDQAGLVLQDKQSQRAQAQSDRDNAQAFLNQLQAQKSCNDMGLYYDITVSGGPVCRPPAAGDPQQPPVTLAQISQAQNDVTTAQNALTAAAAAERTAQNNFDAARANANSTRSTAENDALNAGSSSGFCNIFPTLPGCRPDLRDRVTRTLDARRSYLLKKRDTAAATAARITAQNRRDKLAASLAQVQCLAAGNLYDSVAMTCNPPPVGPGGTAISLFSGADAILRAADDQGVAR